VPSGFTGEVLTLSVIIPVLDDAAPLRRCLEALALLDRPPHEIIVVDNGSSDDSAAIAHAAGATVIREYARGIPAAAKAGLDAATGDVLARIDSDTLVPPSWAGQVLAAFEQDTTLAALTGPGRFYDAGPALAKVARVLYMSAYFRSVAPLVGQRPVFGSNYAMRRSTWEFARSDIHLDANVHDDMDLSFVLDGELGIRYDPNLEVGISVRPVTSPSALAKHFWFAYLTIIVNWRERGPLRRWRERRG